MILSLEIWLFVIAFGASGLGGMLGMASGIFIVPILTMFGHVEVRIAIGASIVSVIACSCGGAAPFLKAGLTNVHLAIVLEAATTLGALTGVFLSGFASTSLLYLIFAIVLSLSAWQMLARRRDPIATAASNSLSRRPLLSSSYPDCTLGREIPHSIDRLWA